MRIVTSVNGVAIRLTDERWRHIVSGHPEMAPERVRVLQSLEDPDMVQAGDFGELLAVRHWPATSLGSKHVVVAYREVDQTDGFILTAYLAPPAVAVEEHPMEAVKILEGRDPMTRTYDEDADVLYLSLGAPRPAVGVDIGDGVILRYDEASNEVVGLTLVGVRAKLLRQLADES